jgi:hypothetical protein
MRVKSNNPLGIKVKTKQMRANKSQKLDRLIKITFIAQKK